MNINYTVGRKSNGPLKEKIYYTVQIGDVVFFDFLKSIGLFPNKSKTIAELAIPEEYFLDFLRGSFDGDGCTHSYWDKRWKSSFMFYTIFVSASEKHILWIRAEIFSRIGIRGHITKSKNQACYQLKYAKRESVLLLKRIYYSDTLLHLPRKKLKIDRMLAIVGESLRK